MFDTSWYESYGGCIDAGCPGTVLGDEPINNDNPKVNMGAYGGTDEASMTPPLDYYGKPWGLAADSDNSGKVGNLDLARFRNQWLQSGEDIASDFNHSGHVTNLDLLIMDQQWLRETSWY